jgi:hypothetical protein
VSDEASTSNANGQAVLVAPAPSPQCSSDASLTCWGRTTVVVNLNQEHAGVAAEPAQVCHLLVSGVKTSACM